MSETCNGWTNYETWVVDLWITKDKSTYNFVNDSIKDFETNIEAADWLKEYLEESMPNHGGTIWDALLHAALSEVDFLEIVQYLKNFRDYEND